MKDIHSGITRVLAIAAATYAADNTEVAIDRKGYESVEILLDIGAGGITFTTTNKIEFKLTHSDDGSTYSPVVDTDMLGGLTVGTGGIIKSLIAAHATGAVYRYGYKGNKRYLKLLGDFSGTHATGTPIAASVLLSRGLNQPESNQH